MVDAFVGHLGDEECSDHTLRCYRDDLNQFARWYADRTDAMPELGTLVKRDLMEWREALESSGGRGGRPAKTATVARKLSAAKSFFAWARTRDKGVRFDPPKPMRQQSRPEPKWLTREEQRALLAAADQASVPRDIAILQLGLEGGMRVSEMSGQDAGDVHIGERKGWMLVKGKGRKERRIPLTKALRHALLEHLRSRRRGPVFEGRDGEALSISSMQKIACGYAKVCKVGRRVGIPGFSIHCLRHSCARRLIEAGVPLPDVAAFLGHSDIKTTMVYVASSDEALGKAAEALDGLA
jgi:integrase/recombinase XerC/integrase/recombinase XerD